MDLTPAQSALASRLFAAGQSTYHEAPVIFGEIRKNFYPDAPGYHLAVIAIPPATAKKVAALLSRELVKVEESQGRVRPAPEAKPAFTLEGSSLDTQPAPEP